MVCSLPLFLCKDGINSLDDEWNSYRALVVIDTIFYPVIAVISSIVFLLLLVVKFIFLSLKFLITYCIALFKSTSVPSLQKSFGCLNSDGLPDWLGCLLIIPLVGTIIHSAIVCFSDLSTNDSFESYANFIQAPVVQICSTALINWS
ncbi:hypothetical protein C10C_0215 [Chlamydia serpentis]|uniref:Uncharacterized protein n=1 Tax=Chlamydia serpentis TaxID=1967782 RepID=A0A2R8FAD8_9CHLA|nr:hypothetical protein [Chlamydia serpentis]SPN73393.1 hypothetical protein C10C_0215 [Chlamydia serpentis]